MSTENVPVDGIGEELYVFPEGEIPTELESVGPEGEDSDDDYGSMPVVEGESNNETNNEIDIYSPSNYFFNFKDQPSLIENKGFTTDQTFLEDNLDLGKINYEGLYTLPVEQEEISPQAQEVKAWINQYPELTKEWNAKKGVDTDGGENITMGEVMEIINSPNIDQQIRLDFQAIITGNNPDDLRYQSSWLGTVRRSLMRTEDSSRDFTGNILSNINKFISRKGDFARKYQGNYPAYTGEGVVTPTEPGNLFVESFFGGKDNYSSNFMEPSGLSSRAWVTEDGEKVYLSQTQVSSQLNLNEQQTANWFAKRLEWPTYLEVPNRDGGTTVFGPLLPGKLEGRMDRDGRTEEGKKLAAGLEVEYHEDGSFKSVKYNGRQYLTADTQEGLLGNLDNPFGLKTPIYDEPFDVPLLGTDQNWGVRALEGLVPGMLPQVTTTAAMIVVLRKANVPQHLPGMSKATALRSTAAANFKNKPLLSSFNYLKGTTIKGISEFGLTSGAIEALAYNQEHGNLVDIAIGMNPSLENPFTKILQSNELDSASWAFIKNFAINEGATGGTFGTGFEMAGDAFNLSRRALKSGIPLDTKLWSQTGIEFQTEATKNYKDLFASTFVSDALAFKVDLLNKIKVGIKEGNIKWPSGETGVQTNKGKSAVTEMAEGGSWSNFLKKNQRKPLWPQPYATQETIDLDAQTRLDSRFSFDTADLLQFNITDEKILNKSIREAKAELEIVNRKVESALKELNETFVRMKDTSQPQEKELLRQMDIDESLIKPLPEEVSDVPVSEIQTAPQYFQVKQAGAGEAEGVSGSLKGSKGFDTELAGLVTLWRDTNGTIGDPGNVYVIDGHNRLDLAKRSGRKNILSRFINVPTWQEARAKAALINIAGTQSLKGSIEALDIAKFLRNEKFSIDDLAERGINLQSSLLAQAVQLNRLPDNLFAQVSTGELTLSKALALGSAEGVSPEAIQDIYKIAKKQRWSIARIEQAIIMARNATVGVEEGVFPELSAYFKQSNIKQLLTIRTEVVKQLKTRIRALAPATRLEQAGILEEITGTTINITGSKEQRLATQAVLNVFNRVAGLDGPVTNILTDLASQLKGNNAASLVKARLSEIEEAIMQESSTASKYPESVFNQSVVKQVKDLSVKTERVAEKTIIDNMPDEDINPKTVVSNEEKFNATFDEEVQPKVLNELSKKGVVTSDPRKINDLPPTTDVTKTKVRPELTKSIKDKITDDDPWFSAKEQTVDLEAEVIEQSPILKALTERPAEIPIEDLEPATTALAKVDPKTPLDLIIRSAPDSQQASIAMNRLVDSFEKFADGIEGERSLGPIDTVGDFINLLNIGRVGIEEGVQKGLRDIKTTDRFARLAAPYVQKAGKAFLQKALDDIDQVKIYTKAVQYQLSQKFKNLEKNILESGKKADTELARIDEWGGSEVLDNIFKKLGYKEQAERLAPTTRPTFKDTSMPKNWAGGSSPKYGSMFIEWESDVDKAIYVVTTAKAGSKNSKRHDKFWYWLTAELGIPEDVIVETGSIIRSELKENFDDGGNWKVEDTDAWKFGGQTDLMTFDFEDARLKKVLNEQDVELLKKYLDINDPKAVDLVKEAKQKYETDYLELFPIKDGYADKTLNSNFAGPLSETQIQEELLRTARRIFPAGKVEFPFELKGLVKESHTKAHASLKGKVGRTVTLRGEYSPSPKGAAYDVVRVAQAYGGVPASFSQRYWTTVHESVHGVFRRFYTRADAELLLQGEKHLREIAASVVPHKAIDILNGKEAFHEVVSYASMGWEKVKGEYLTPGKPDPTWAQPLQKLKQLVEAVKTWLGRKGYKTWDELFEATVSGEFAANRSRGLFGPVAAPDTLKVGNNLYHFGAWGRGVEEPDFLPAFPEVDPEDFNARVEGYKAQLNAGSKTLLELMMSETRRLVSRGRDAKGHYTSKKPGKTLYLSMSEEGFILSSKVVEDQIKELIGETRADRTDIAPVKSARILHAAKELAIGNEMNTEKVLKLWEQARGGDITAENDLITSTAIGVLRDQNALAIKELSVTFKGIKDGSIDIEQKALLASKLTSLWQNQLVLNKVWEQITRKWGQLGSQLQMKVETDDLTLQSNTPLKSYQVSDELVEDAMSKGLQSEEGLLGEGVYFTTNNDPNGIAVIDGSLPSDIVILDLVRAGKSLASFLEELDLGPFTGKTLTEEQRIGIRNYITEKGYDGVRFPTDLTTESVGDRVVIYDNNNANRVINSEVVKVDAEVVDAEPLRPFIERTIREAGQILEKKLEPEVLKAIQSGQLSVKAELLIDELAEVAYTMNTLPKQDATFFIKDVSDLIEEIPDGMAFQRTIADIRRNALFLRISTWGKVALAGTTRMLGMPIARYIGNGKMYREAMNHGNYFAAESAKIRQSLDLDLFRQIFYAIPNAMRLSRFAWKTGETLVNPGRQHYADARVNQFAAQDKAGNLLTEQQFAEAGTDRALVKRKAKNEDWFTKPTANPIALAIRYINSWAPTRFLYQTGSRKGLAAVDTFINGMVGPATEHARLMELALHEMRAKGVLPTEANYNKVVEKVNKQMKTKWVDMIINGELIEKAYLDSPYAKNAMDYVNMTDDIKVDPEKRSWRYGIKKAEEMGIVDASEKVAFAEEYAKTTVDPENFYKGYANKEVNAAFHNFRKGIPHIAQKIKETEQAFPITGAVIATNRTLINLFKGTVRYVGLGEHIIDTAWRDINHEDANIRANALGEYAIGQFLLTAGTLTALTGMLEYSGTEPVEWREREKWKRIGKQANSIRLKFPWGGAGPWVNLGAFDAASPILAIIGNWQRELDRIPIHEREDGNDNLTAMMGIHVAAIRNAIFKTGTGMYDDASLKQITDLFELFQDFTDLRDHRHVRGKSSAAGVWLERLLTGMIVPGVIQEATYGLDPTVRKIEESDAWGPVATLLNTLERVKSKLPYFSYGQPALLHQITGEPIVMDGHLGSGLSQNLWDPFKLINGALNPLNAFKIRTQSTDIVDEEMARLVGKNSSFVIWDRRMLSLPNYILSTTELNELIVIGTQEVKNSDGLTLHEELTRIITESPRYANKKDMGNITFPWGDDRDPKKTQRANIYGPGEKVNYLMETIKQYQDKAVILFLKRNPDLQEEKNKQEEFNYRRNATTDNLGPQSNLEAWRALIA